MKTAISVPEPIFEAAERLAQQLGISRSELYATAVKRFIDEHDDATITQALDTVYGDEESKLDPILEKMQLASLELEEWS